VASALFSSVPYKRTFLRFCLTKVGFHSDMHFFVFMPTAVQRDYPAITAYGTATTSSKTFII
jgi:hypothetical protein